ncbi:N utilization substance protein B [Dysgonomonadaceae bacterium PH5-43]|nr:N utilization substance protein B [Dysgonomonadaceae bacterium PH5-43]
MINRVLIRIKVLQVVYAYYLKRSGDIKSAEKELIKSLQRSYDLYLYLLQLIVVLTDVEQKRLDALKYKYLPTEQELNPNTRFIDNKFAEQLRLNKTLVSFINNNGSVWSDDDMFLLRNLLKEILSSDIYKEYLQSPDVYESDKEFWRKIFKNIILKNEELEDLLQDKDIYWDSDFGVVATFVVKTIKSFNSENGEEQELLPMYKSNDDLQFAVTLLHKSILEHEETQNLIDKQIKNWDIDRIAQMDLYIMQTALSEIKNFPSIPVSVSLNEYIDLAHFYSTPNSSNFINGILDSIVNELKTTGVLFKS